VCFLLYPHCKRRRSGRYSQVKPHLGCAGLVTLAISFVHAADTWQSTLTPPTPGNFPPLRSLHATYNFGWSGVTAATADIHFTRTGDRCTIEAKTRTIDMARGLWPFDAEHFASGEAATMRPVQVKQTEVERKKNVHTELTFDARGVTAKRTDSKSGSSVRRFDIANLFDLQTALLFTRSQPLTNGSAVRAVVFPAEDPYLTTVTVEGRERITTPAGAYNAIKCDLKLAKIGRNNELKPHKKFRKATIWVSDDADRMLLRAEAEIFVGTVFAELQSVQFEGATKRD
jgi:hypothetical protein